MIFQFCFKLIKAGLPRKNLCSSADKKMSKPKVNEELCIGCGTCAEICKGVFEVKDDGKSHVIAEDCGDCNCEEAVSSCPTSAISIE